MHMYRRQTDGIEKKMTIIDTLFIIYLVWLVSEHTLFIAFPTHSVTLLIIYTPPPSTPAP